MVTEIVPAEQTWRLLWSHIASQVVSTLPPHDDYKTVYAGYGWGVVNAQNQRGLLVHPTGEGREIVDLSFVVDQTVDQAGVREPVEDDSFAGASGG